MAVKPRQDLTTGNPASHFRQLAVPGALGMLFNTLYNIVDMYFASLLGTSAQAGFGLGIRLEQVLLLPVIGVTGALFPIAAQNFGAGDDARVREAVFLCWRFGFVMTAIGAPPGH